MSRATFAGGGPTVECWLAGPLPADVRTALARLRACPDVRRIAVMPDVHLAHDVCVGTVLATGDLLYPGAVGGDIGCGMAAVAFDAAAADLVGDAAAAGRLLAALYEAVPANRHRRPRDLPAACGGGFSDPRLDAVARRDGRVQLGTLGRGNHFLELQADDADGGRLWLMAHTGSRALGQAIRDHHLEVARAQCPPGALPHLDARAPAGSAYLADMDRALAYARANRDAIVRAAGDVLRRLFGATAVDGTRVDCHHNFVRREAHFGESLWVHRKGACPAGEGEAGVVPGSMGSASYHTAGRGCAAALGSSSHGAGRAMSRDAARRAVSAAALCR